MNNGLILPPHTFEAPIFSGGVRAFCSPQTLGNRHHVYVYNHGYDDDKIQVINSLASGNSDCTWVFVFLEPGNNESARVRFWQNDCWIQRCGSGTLAAYWALDQLGQTHINTLQTDCETVAKAEHNDYWGYLASSLPITHSNIFPELNECLDNAPEESYLSGSTTDYILAIYQTQKQVEELVVYYEPYCALTKRALIVSAPSQNSHFDYVLRYFAPQWGNTEDNATGSANLMVAPYWSAMLNKKNLKALQCSQNKGEIYLELDQVATYSESHALNRYNIKIFGQCQAL